MTPVLNVRAAPPAWKGLALVHCHWSCATACSAGEKCDVPAPSECAPRRKHQHPLVHEHRASVCVGTQSLVAIHRRPASNPPSLLSRSASSLLSCGRPEQVVDGAAEPLEWQRRTAARRAAAWTSRAGRLQPMTTTELRALQRKRCGFTRAIRHVARRVAIVKSPSHHAEHSSSACSCCNIPCTKPWQSQLIPVLMW